jgi:hypothetical protein
MIGAVLFISGWDSVGVVDKLGAGVSAPARSTRRLAPFDPCLFLAAGGSEDPPIQVLAKQSIAFRQDIQPSDLSAVG